MLSAPDPSAQMFIHPGESTLEVTWCLMIRSTAWNPQPVHSMTCQAASSHSVPAPGDHDSTWPGSTLTPAWKSWTCLQNDLQAMARCHRIGQEKEVTIYRLVCRDTYEAQIFQTSSCKYGEPAAGLCRGCSRHPIASKMHPVCDVWLQAHQLLQAFSQPVIGPIVRKWPLAELRSLGWPGMPCTVPMQKRGQPAS